MFCGSTIDLSRSSLSANLEMIRSLLQGNARLSTVIKGNAYGHGLEQMATLLQEEGVDHFSVFNADEAYSVCGHMRPKDTLMIMGDVEGDAIEWAISEGVEFYVFCLDRLQRTVAAAKHIRKRALIHLEVETGMNRTGLNYKDFKQALAVIEQNRKHVTFAGLCTHLAGAESIANFHRIASQMRKFKSASEICERLGVRPEIRHACSSAGLLRYPRMHLDLVRVGILQYGHWPSAETRIEHLTKRKLEVDPFQPVLTWKSSVMSTKDVKAGQFVGYGMGYQAASDIRIAIIPVGYAYGYSRALSNQGFVLIKGRRASVIGTINMNALTVDVTELPDVQRGDDVVLIGRDGDDAVTVSSFGELSRQLNYELLTKLPASIPRHTVA